MNSYGLETEQAVIGSLLLDYKRCGDAAAEIQPEWFSSDIYRNIMRRIKELVAAKVNPDSITIIENLSEQEKREVFQCVQMTFSISNFTNYAEQLKSAWRKRTVEQRLQCIAFEGIDDIDDTIEELRAIVKEQDEIVSASNKEVGIKFMDAAADYYTSLYKDAVQYKTGFPMFDKTTGGLLPSTVMVLAARPGQGKTDFAISLMLRFAARGLRVIYYTMEMTYAQILTRISAQLTGINNTRIRDRKDLTQAEKNDICSAFSSIKGSENIRFVEEKPSLTIIRRDIKSYKPDIIFLDHIGLMKTVKRNRRVEEVSETTQALHDLALETGTTIIEIVQMNRGVEQRKSKRPTLSDLKESGSIEEDADYVVFLQVDKGEKPLTGNEAYHYTAFIEKNRHGGTGVVHMKWRPQYSRFTEVDGIHEYGGDLR